MQITFYHNQHNISLDAVCFFDIVVGNIPTKKSASLLKKINLQQE